MIPEHIPSAGSDLSPDLTRFAIRLSMTRRLHIAPSRRTHFTCDRFAVNRTTRPFSTGSESTTRRVCDRLRSGQACASRTKERRRATSPGMTTLVGWSDGGAAGAAEAGAGGKRLTAGGAEESWGGGSWRGAGGGLRRGGGTRLGLGGEGPDKGDDPTDEGPAEEKV